MKQFTDEVADNLQTSKKEDHQPQQDGISELTATDTAVATHRLYGRSGATRSFQGSRCRGQCHQATLVLAL